jgi:hypothetical protein
MAAKDIEAGRAHVVLAIRNQLSAGLNAAFAEFQRFGSNVGTIGKTMAVGGAGIVGAFGSVASLIGGAAVAFAGAGSELADMSARTGIAASSLSALQYAAQQTGAEMSNVEAAVSKMQKGIGAAADGSKEAKGQLSDLGLRIEDLAKMTPEQQFSAIAGKLSTIKDPTMQAAAAMGVFGKSATAILPMINSDIGALIGEANALGLVMSDDDVAAADALGDSIDKLKSVFSGIVNAIGSAVAGPLTAFLELAVAAVSGVIGWVKANRGLVAAIAGVAVAGVAVGAVIFGIGTSLVVLGAVISGAVTVFGVIAGIISTFAGPILILVGAFIAAGVAAFVYRDALMQSFGAVVAWMQPVIDAFYRIFEAAGSAIDGIVTALSSGNIQLAGEIALGALKAMFWQAVTEIPGSGRLIASGFGQALLAGRWDLMAEIAISNVKLAIMKGWNSIANFWSGTLAGLGAMWDMAVYGIRTGWHKASTGIASAMLWVVGKIGDGIVGLQILFDALVTAAKIAAVFVKSFFSGSMKEGQAEAARLQQELQNRTANRVNKNEANKSGVQKNLFEDAARTQKKIDQDFAKNMIGRSTAEQDAVSKRRQSETDLEQRISGLNGQAKTAASDAGVTTAEDAAFKAKYELAALTDQARTDAESKGKDAGRIVQPAGESKGLPKVETRGTFSAAAATTFGNRSNAQEATARNTAMANKLLRVIADKKGPQFT